MTQNHNCIPKSKTKIKKEKKIQEEEAETDIVRIRDSN
jgi:hypothetical protein